MNEAKKNINETLREMNKMPSEGSKIELVRDKLKHNPREMRIKMGKELNTFTISIRVLILVQFFYTGCLFENLQWA